MSEYSFYEGQSSVTLVPNSDYDVSDYKRIDKPDNTDRQSDKTQSLQFAKLYADFWALTNLRDNWDGEGTLKPTIKTITVAAKYLLNVSKLNFLPSRIIPSAEGGLGFIYLVNGKQADIEFLNSGEVLVGVYPIDSMTEVWDVSEVGLEESVAKIREFLQ
jgi:hypothetical protein